MDLLHSTTSGTAALAALTAFGASRAVREFASDVMAQRNLLLYPTTTSAYVALHRGGTALIALYAHREWVDALMDRPTAEHLHAVTKAELVDEGGRVFLRLRSSQLHHTGHRALLLDGAVEGVDWSATKHGRSPVALRTRAASPLVAATPSTCPRCWTVPAANGVCSCRG